VNVNDLRALIHAILKYCSERGPARPNVGEQWSPDRIRAVHPTNSVKHFLDEILLWRVPDFLHVVAFRQISLL